jgi:glutamine synthetase
MYLMPDPATFKVIPWESEEGLATARMICDVYTPAGEPFPGSPRGVLKRMVAKAEEMGYIYNTRPECEFFLFHKGAAGDPTLATHDKGGYFGYSTDAGVGVRKDMVTALEALGIQPEASHHEVATGQHEIDFRYGDAVTTADSVITFKYVLKAVAAFRDLYATFMPKPIAGINGSGMHTHQSLVYKATGENAFADADDEFGLSTIANPLPPALSETGAYGIAASPYGLGDLALWFKMSMFAINAVAIMPGGMAERDNLWGWVIAAAVISGFV